ncbi:MAG: hypothetical protein MAG551_02550 [Candidatus Scalindua arabica]|uniref:Uncharacterized protein n=1 Tax=Candidatus Scalindua arabica TaxID=1127984 RepID=A0A941W531_9BACT|nr:hypothetical protein [Candidatus Scalindua arabica]
MDTLQIKIIKAEWDLRAKTKFLKVEGIIMVDAFDDEVVAEQDEEHATNENILTINLIVNPGTGPKQRQPSPFHFVRMTDGDEPWTHVQAKDSRGAHVTYPITKISIA